MNNLLAKLSGADKVIARLQREIVNLTNIIAEKEDVIDIYRQSQYKLEQELERVEENYNKIYHSNIKLVAVIQHLKHKLKKENAILKKLRKE